MRTSSVVIALRGYDIRPPSQCRAEDDDGIIHPTVAAHSYSCSYSFSVIRVLGLSKTGLNI
jgi:hypothetical protein